MRHPQRCLRPTRAEIAMMQPVEEFDFVQQLAMLGKPVPEFALPPVKGRTLGLASADLNGEVSLVNVFASWCVACREEHPAFMRLNAAGIVPIHGLNYKDQPDDAARWLDTMGD